VQLLCNQNFAMLLLGGALLGVGSSIFHPETSRLARLASGGAHGLAQSIFQVGRNFGSSLGPPLMIFLILPNGQHSLAWFSLAAMLGIVMLSGLAHWYKQHGQAIHKKQVAVTVCTLSRNKVVGAIAVLVLLTFSKYFYLVSITSYYIFYYAQELVPNRVGMISGLFFGLAFGMGGLGAAVLGTLADHTSIDFVYKVCAFLPALGLFTALLPDTNPPDKSRESRSAA
jgi:FSR family fosmidomycin resistance protein-like MFS transporter